jgi:RNA polymerase sigma factor (sigma-70 family)
MDDEDLHERIIMLDPAGLAEWETRHRPSVIGWLVRGGLEPSDAEEVWNDAFAATVNAAPDLTPRGISLRRYAFRVARNLRADRLSLRARSLEARLEAGIDRANPHSPQSMPDRRRIDALKRCLASCPERYRVVIELGEEGRDVEELAAILAIEPGSVYQVRRRARQWLQACINEAVG